MIYGLLNFIFFKEYTLSRMILVKLKRSAPGVSKQQINFGNHMVFIYIGFLRPSWNLPTAIMESSDHLGIFRLPTDYKTAAPPRLNHQKSCLRFEKAFPLGSLISVTYVALIYYSSIKKVNTVMLQINAGGVY